MHFEAFEIFAVIAEGRHLRSAQRVFLIHFVALQVILTEGCDLKETAAVDRHDVIFHAVHDGDRRALDLRADDFALGGIVVGKDDRIGQDIQLGGSFRNIAVFIFPVCFNNDEVVRLQHAFRMVQPGDRVFMVIFRADREQDAEGFELLEVALEFVVRLRNAGLLTDLNAVYAVVADNAAPECVVQIECERLFIFAEDRFNNI